VPPDKVAWVVQTLSELGARQKAEAVANEHHQQAMRALEKSGASGEACQALRELAINLLDRVS
jgi:geranylgeranyl pyrophosphate synthase